MQLIIENFTDNPNSFLRQCGYAFLRHEGKELSFVRRLAGTDYPRFHVYCYLESKKLVVNLHLDQKKPSYEGTAAHGGEYRGELIEEEIKRIEKIGKGAKPSPNKKIEPW